MFVAKATIEALQKQPVRLIGNKRDEVYVLTDCGSMQPHTLGFIEKHTKLSFKISINELSIAVTLQHAARSRSKVVKLVQNMFFRYREQSYFF